MMFDARSLCLPFLVIMIVLSGDSAVQSAQAQTPPPVQAGKCRSGVPSYSTIQAAVNAAPVGGQVYICPGIYPEQIAINKSLTLQGVQSGNAAAWVIVPPAAGLVQNATDPSPASANPPIAAQIFVQGPATVNLTNLMVDGGANQLSGCTAPTLVGIYYQNASGTLKNLDVRNEALSPADASCNNGLGMYFESNTATSITLNISTVTNFQKNGVTASGYGNGSPGPVVSFWGDEVVGQGAAAGTIQNGVQIGFGATGQVASSIISDLVFQSTGTSNAAATGVLIYASNGVTVLGNQIGNTQFGVAVASDPIYGTGDTNTINSNTITAAMFDAVDVCSNTNIVKNGQIYNSKDAGVRIDARCTEGPAGGSSGNGNTVSNNAINGGCTGILQGTGSGNIYSSSNQFINTFTAMLPGNSCTPPLGMTAVIPGSPAPFR
jgi:hypothetical protein